MEGDSPFHRPRALVLVREAIMSWPPFYVAALRELCDVITCGPALDRELYEREGVAHAARWLEPNNIVSDADTLEEIFALLPPGWRPEIIITIQSSGAVIRDIARATCPTAYISVDSWHDPNEYVYPRGYDFVFAAQKQLAPYFIEAGVPRAHWLPLAHSPTHHHPVDSTSGNGIVFIGTTTYGVNRERVKRLLRLREHFDVGVMRGAVGDVYCQAVSAGSVVFNSSVAQDVNMRVFEAMAIGRPLLTNRDAAINGLDDLFEEGVHYLGYDDEDLIEQAARLLNDEALRRRIAGAAREAVMAKHTYRHRMETLLSTVFAAVPPSQCELRDAPRLSAWLPNGARRVLDFGLGMDRSRIALRRVGVTWLGGVPFGEAGMRANSFDALLPNLERVEDVDTITCAHPVDLKLPLDGLLAGAAQVLPPGGELVLLLSASEAYACGPGLQQDLWEAWAEAGGFHLILFHVMSADGAVVIATRLRRYLRSSVDISAEIFTRFPGGGVEEFELPEE